MVVTTMMRLNSNNDDVTTRNENQNCMEFARIYKNMSISRKVLQPQNENLQTTENNINSLNFCNCLKNRNMSRGDHQRQEQFKRKYRRKHSLTYPNYYSSDNNSITGTLNSNTINTNLKSYSDCFNPHPLNSFTSITTISVTTLYNNLLQHVLGGAGSGSSSQGWHITTAAASTAITIFATLYYIMANTQGASAVLAVETATSSSSSASSALSFPITNLTFYPSTSSNNINNSSSLSSNTHLNIGVSGSSSGINHHSIHPSSYLDLNYYINSTEITILNSVSSLPTTKASAYSTSNNNNIITVTHSTNNNNNNVISFNDSLDDMSAEDASEYIFDRTDVRIIFITLYTMVFCCCFFGNLLVILVVTLSRRLRSITNFFLANLALADFCVGLFCVMQNLSIYLIDSWVFGEFLCRMYQFVHSLSYTASIFILVVICMERYFAIVHPITCKQILTAARLRMVILTVWITSAVYSTPKFVFSKTIKNVHTESGREEEICVLDRKMFNSKLLDMINFGLLYCIPLLVMTILYSKIAIALWRSSRGLQHHLNQQENSMTLHNSMYHHNNHQHQHNHNHNNHHQHLHSHHQQQQQQQLQNTQLQQQQQQLQPTPLGTPISVNSSVVSATTLSRKQSCKYEKRGVSLTESQHENYKVSLDADRPVVSTCRKKSFYQHCHNHFTNHQQPQTTATTAAMPANNSRPTAHTHTLHGSVRVSHISHSSNNVLRARRGVVRMLIIFVLTFALCNLPYHARKMWQYWSRSYRGDSNFNALFTPLTFLVTYFNSGINPLLYAFLSRNFRKGMRELLMCSWRKSKTKSSTNSSMHHKRHTTLQHSLPTDTTHIGNEQL